jgi:iron(II)-dependent oxidoreductase
LEQGPLKNIRGGAFDTYFENQATCQFASGEAPLARKHNIGFRCVLGTCDLAANPAAPLTEPAEELLAECEVTV